MPRPIFPTSSTPISTRPSAPRSGCRDGSRELRDSSQAAALEVEKFRAENGLTSARGELMSEQQLSDLNSQLIVAQADTANALGPLQPVQVDHRQRSGKRRQECDDPVRQRPTAPSSTISRRATSASPSASRRSPPASAKTIRRRLRCAASRPTWTRQIFQELQQLTESYRNEYEVAKSRETSLRDNVGEMAGQNSQTSQSHGAVARTGAEVRLRLRRSTRPSWPATRRLRSSARFRSPRRA